MRERLHRLDAVNAVLRRLEQYTSLSPFSRIFYRFIYELLCMPGIEDEKLEQAFHLFIRVECRRHHAVSQIVHRGKIDLYEIAGVGRAVHHLLDRLFQAVERLERASPRRAIIRELILAECSYHLGRTDGVIQGLRRAVGLGCRHPLVHFALGYNLYASAFKRFSRQRDPGKRPAGFDIAAFEALCREAISSFSRGLGETTFDAQIHWWIGLVSETLGEEDGAREAYGRAMAVDPDNFRERVRNKLRSLGGSIERSAEEREKLSRLGPITDEEIRTAREILDANKSFPKFFLDAEDA